MDEKIIIQSEQRNVRLVSMCVFIVLTILSIVILHIAFEINLLQDIMEKQRLVDSYGIGWYNRMMSRTIGYYVLIPVAGSGLIAALIYWWLASTQIVVTNKRVYGKTVFGKRVDLPLDSISAVGSNWPQGIAVATSSGKVSFPMIKNADKIHKCVSTLLLERQSKATPVTTIKQEIPQSNADELKKYKELLDSGVISQEEFDVKKKQLLGL